ncbi:MAG: hypothetical protein KGP35_06515 [Bacteroidetes bacterium]|nr:hypothetical protein [Bacteroidota bacterium]
MPLHSIIICLFVFYTAPALGQHISIVSKKQAGNFIFTLPLESSSAISNETALQIEAKGPIEGDRNGSILFRGSVKKKKLSGQWVSYHRNGNMLDSGYFVKGIPDGIWKVWDRNGILIHKRKYDADLFFRVLEEIKTKHPRYQKYVLTKQYLKEGKSILHFMKAAYSFNNTKLPSVNTLEALVLHNNDKPHLYHPPFISCLHDGEFTDYTSSGAITDSGYYQNGLKEHIWIHYNYRKAETEKGAYRKGKKIHAWKTYDDSGQLKHVRFYSEEGKLEWEKDK